MVANNFTWLPFFEELLDKICIENSPKELYDLWLKFFPDKYEYYSNENKVPINKIDPLTFIGKILSLGDERLLEICSQLKERYALQSEVPSKFDGIPRTDRTNPTFWNDAWKGSKSPEDEHFTDVVNNLWNFAINLNKVDENNINLDEALMKTILSYDKIGIPKLSQIMFVLKPNIFYSCDGKSLSYLCIEITNNKDYQEFLEIQSISKETGEKPFNLSYIAELYSRKRKKFFDYAEKIKNTRPSYTDFIAQQIQNEKFEKIIYKITSKHIYDVETEESLDEIISQLRKSEDWGKYNDKHGNGIPHAILNTHYRNYIKNNTPDLFEQNIEDIFMNNNQSKQNNVIPLNQILYGPPGTGKTYKTKAIINSIIKNNKQKKKNINFDFSNMTWHEAIAIGMYNRNQEWYSTTELKAIPEIQMIFEIKNNKNLRAALWAYMQQHTSPDIETVKYSNRYEPFLFEKNTDSKWKLTDDGRKYVEDNLSTYIQGQESDEKVEYCKFITFHQSYAYEDFIEGIKPDCKEDSVTYNIQKGVFKDICLRANNDPENNYVIVIDEINRGNISKIFGELITLIEPDKRVIPNGEYSFENTEVLENQLLVTLPYSQKKFGVPKNLYIVGTMNTSDRSIASIDIALRRRFVFKEMMPNVNLVPDIKVFGIDLRNIFTTLNERISVLLDRDHQIGHSYFMKINNETDLERVWFDNVLPLLNEYFYGDWEKLCALLGDFQPEGKSFIKKINNVKFANSYSCDEDETYDFVSEANIDFEEAIKNAFKNI